MISNLAVQALGPGTPPAAHRNIYIYISVLHLWFSGLCHHLFVTHNFIFNVINVDPLSVHPCDVYDFLDANFGQLYSVLSLSIFLYIPKKYIYKFFD